MSDQRLSQIGPYLSAGLASVDQAVSMLITVQLGLFVLVGFVLRGTLAADHRPTPAQSLAGCVFLVCAFASVTLGYAARMQALESVDLARPDFSAVEITVGRQAFFVATSAIFALFVAVVSLFETSPALNSTATIPSGPAPASPIPVTNKDATGT
jgi:hypothetical protein